MGIRINSNRSITKPKHNIDYTARDFDSIKERLVDYVKINYPDTYKDFNASSFGSLMFDLVAYVGDQLAFYTDYIAAESNLVTAQEENSVRDLVTELGGEVDLDATATGDCEITFRVPADADGNPESDYYVNTSLRAGPSSPSFLFATDSGETFTMNDDFMLQENRIDFINTEVADIDGSKVKVFVGRIKVPVSSGQIAQQSATVGNPSSAPRVQIKNNNVTDIMSVTDSEGNEYFQVDSLTSNTVVRSVPNIGANSSKTSSIMKDEPVLRRFVVLRERGKTFLEFPGKSDAKIKQNLIAEPSNLTVKMSGKSTVDGLASVDPTKMVAGDTFGVAPSNTTLTITYKHNIKNNVNVAVGTLNSVLSTGFVFKDEHLLNPSFVNYVKNSVTVRNPDPINGHVSMASTDELKSRHKGTFAAQKRAVTLQDYKTAVYSMPSRYGKIKRASVLRDVNDYRRNLNIYLVAEGPDGKLQSPNQELYKNVKMWVNKRRMISDSVDLFPAYIVNLGIEYDIQTDGTTSRERLMGPIREALYEELTIKAPEIGENFNIAKIWSFIQNFPGVSMVKSVNLVSKTGEGYTGNLYKIKGRLRPMESLYIENDHIWEIKRPADIRMKQFSGRYN
jgi:hypothetical protein|tara:strand:+ start:3689 stop:5548 length:1860 start_codon:yes stop_codon:yes gene_type:complete